MNRNHFMFLRIFTCIALLALLGGRILTNGPTINLLLFLLLVAFWFVPTMLLNFVHAKTPRAIMLSNTLYAVLDAYVLMMATAEAAADIWTKPFLLLGAYVFLASLMGGTVAGAGSAISGFCGLLNGWLIPTMGEVPLPALLGGVGASAAGFVCGSAWRLILPLVVRTAQQQQDRKVATGTSTAPPQKAILADMETRLLEITAKRDHAQKRLRQLETQQAAAATPPPVDNPTATKQPPKAKPPMPAEEPVTPQVYLQQMETELADIQAEKTTLATEKQNLQTEISQLSNKLMASFFPTPPANPPETPAIATPTVTE